MKPYFASPLSHYHGDIVRKLFFTAGVIMLAGLPFFNDRLPFSVIISILAIVGIGLIAGLTNPVKRWPAVINTLAAVIGTVVFEYYAVQVYQLGGAGDILFWANQGLAIIFVVALYYSTKTLRAMTLG